MKKSYSLLLFAAAVMFCIGCGKTADTPAPAAGGHAGHVHEHVINGWCVDHEVPEAECSLCDKKVAAECKKSGDWCEQHDRAASQCFVCDPSRKEKFAAKYRAQHNAEPPVPHQH